MPRDITPAGFIYAIQADHVHLIKLGYSTDPAARLADLRTGCPVVLTLLAIWRATCADETALHQEFAQYREHGEWFRPAPAVVSRLLVRNEASPNHIAELNGQRRPRPNGDAETTHPGKRRLRPPGRLAAPSGYDLRYRKNGSVGVYECLGDGHRPKRRSCGTIPAAEVEAIKKLPPDEQRQRLLMLAQSGIGREQ
jgi:Meiotically up-regulated gene 113